MEWQQIVYEWAQSLGYPGNFSKEQIMRIQCEIRQTTQFLPSPAVFQENRTSILCNIARGFIRAPSFVPQAIIQNDVFMEDFLHSCPGMRDQMLTYVDLLHNILYMKDNDEVDSPVWTGEYQMDYDSFVGQNSLAIPSASATASASASSDACRVNPLHASSTLRIGSSAFLATESDNHTVSTTPSLVILPRPQPSGFFQRQTDPLVIPHRGLSGADLSAYEIGCTASSLIPTAIVPPTSGLPLDASDDKESVQTIICVLCRRSNNDTSSVFTDGNELILSDCGCQMHLCRNCWFQYYSNSRQNGGYDVEIMCPSNAHNILPFLQATFPSLGNVRDDIPENIRAVWITEMNGRSLDTEDRLCSICRMSGHTCRKCEWKEKRRIFLEFHLAKIQEEMQDQERIHNTATNRLKEPKEEVDTLRATIATIESYMKYLQEQTVSSLKIHLERCDDVSETNVAFQTVMKTAIGEMQNLQQNYDETKSKLVTWEHQLRSTEESIQFAEICMDALRKKRNYCMAGIHNIENALLSR